MTLFEVGLAYWEWIHFHDALDAFDELFQTPDQRMGRLQNQGFNDAIVFNLRDHGLESGPETAQGYTLKTGDRSYESNVARSKYSLNIARFYRTIKKTERGKRNGRQLPSA